MIVKVAWIILINKRIKCYQDINLIKLLQVKDLKNIWIPILNNRNLNSYKRTLIFTNLIISLVIKTSISNAKNKLSLKNKTKSNRRWKLRKTRGKSWRIKGGDRKQKERGHMKKGWTSLRIKCRRGERVYRKHHTRQRNQ